MHLAVDNQALFASISGMQEVRGSYRAAAEEGKSARSHPGFLGWALLSSALLAAVLAVWGYGREPIAAGPVAVHWVRTIDPVGASALLGKEGLIVLDIRTPEEFAQGHLPGATNLNFRAPDFAVCLAQLDREQTYLVHCASGGRSTKSLATFSRLGFKSILHMDGGMEAWVGAGQPME